MNELERVFEGPGRSREERRVRYGDRLRRAREAAGLSQRAVASDVGVDQKIVSRAEQGQGSEETFVALQRLYGMPVDALPCDPVRRIETHHAMWSAIRIVPPASGTFGAGKAPVSA